MGKPVHLGEKEGTVIVRGRKLPLELACHVTNGTETGIFLTRTVYSSPLMLSFPQRPGVKH